MKKGKRTWPCSLVVLMVLVVSPGCCSNVSSATTEDTLLSQPETNTTSITIEAQVENSTSFGSSPNGATLQENNTLTTTVSGLSLPTSTVTAVPNSTSDVTPSEYSAPTTEPHSTTTELTTREGTTSEPANSTTNHTGSIENSTSGSSHSSDSVSESTEVSSISATGKSDVMGVAASSTYEPVPENTTNVQDAISQIENASSVYMDFEITMSSTPSVVTGNSNVSEVTTYETSTVPSENASVFVTEVLNATLPEEIPANASHSRNVFANTSEASLSEEQTEDLEHSNSTNIPNTTIPSSNVSSSVAYENPNTTEASHETSSTANSTELNSTTSIPVSNVTSFAEFDNDTAYPSYDANVTVDEGDTIPTVVVQPWFVLQFAGNCSLVQEESNDFEKGVREMLLSRTGVPDQNVSVNIYNCSKNILVNVSLSAAYEPQLSQLLKKLDYANDSKLHINDDTYLVKVIGPADNNAFRQPPEVILSSRHTDIEFVIYVALGSACAFLLVLAVLLVTCKYCRTKPYKGFDVSDVSHLNLRLEDYTLTRIPRPKSIYADYCRGSSRSTERYCPLDEQAANQTNGMVHAFDTSVVPLEDVPAADQQGDPQKAEATAKQKSSSTNDYEEIEGNSVKSTENLHQKKSVSLAPAPWGVDNESFAT